jgi:hypothetical protein
MSEMSPAEFRALYEGILDRMTKAKWIENYVFKKGNGIKVTWSEEGNRRAGILNFFVQLFDLRGGPHHARIFDMASEELLTKGETKRGEVSELHAFFWKNCMDDLKLHRNDDDFHSLVHVIDDYGPVLRPEDLKD